MNMNAVNSGNPQLNMIAKLLNTKVGHTLSIDPEGAASTST